MILLILNFYHQSTNFTRNFNKRMNQNMIDISNSLEHFIDNQFNTKLPKSLYEPIKYILNLGGKRIRPILLLLAYQLYRSDYHIAIPSAFAIELFHNFSLVHDDIMDKSPIRRSSPTVHVKYNENSAILSGDVMLIYVYKYLFENTENQFNNIIDTFNKTAIEVCEGQQLDIDFEKLETVSIEDYFHMIELKTAVLLGASLKIGAILGGADDQDSKYLYDFGVNLGVAFQIQDDILDTFGDSSKFGKKIGGDIINNKKTLLYILAFQNSTVAQNNALKNAYLEKNDTIKIEKVTKLFEQLDLKKLASEYQKKYYEIAFENLKKVSVEPSKKNELITLTTNLFLREQ